MFREPASEASGHNITERSEANRPCQVSSVSIKMLDKQIK